MKLIKLILAFLICNVANAQHWQQFGYGLIAGASLTVDSAQNRLCLVAKMIDQGDTILTPAYWDGFQWKQLGNFDFTNTGVPYKLCVYDSILYVSGTFNKAAGAPGDYILKLNGNSWDTLDYSPDGSVWSMQEFNGDLFFGGDFQIFTSVYSSDIIGTNDSTWTIIPHFTIALAEITALKVFDGKLIIAGMFNADLTLDYLGNIAAWDGDTILPLDEGVEYMDWFSTITDMEEYDGLLYISGNFRLANVANGLRIVSWNGQHFNEVGGGTNYDINALQVYNNELYAAGYFATAGGIPASKIAKWNGSKWCSLGDSINGFISDMCVFNNELFILGSFTQINGQPVEHIAKWIGGSFVDSCSSPISVVEIESVNPFQIYPNPTDGKFIVKSKIKVNRGVNWKIFNSLGETILAGTKDKFEKLEIDLTHKSPGIYYVRMFSDEYSYCEKIVVR